jgi:alkanesulfonate monooxygenase
MTPVSERPEPRFDWFIPIDGDGEHIGTIKAERPPTFENLRKIVDAAEECSYYSMLIPTRFANGLFESEEPLAETWTMVTALAAVSSRIRFLIAVRPGFISPGLFAQMAASLSQISGGRIDINIVPGGIQGEFEKMGENIDHDTRYERAEEFIAALRELWKSPKPVIFEGEHVRLNGAHCSPGPVGEGPKFYLGGASPAALRLAGRQSDVYLAWIAPQEGIAKFIDNANAQFAEAGRPSAFGLRSHIVMRDTEEEAWAASEELLSRAEKTVQTQRKALFAGTAMVGQRGQIQKAENHRLGAHLWNGISTVRVNCGTALVGSPDQIANELLGYWRLGIDEFILSGYPHMEEARRVASGLLPRIKALIEAERAAA